MLRLKVIYGRIQRKCSAAKIGRSVPGDAQTFPSQQHIAEHEGHFEEYLERFSIHSIATTQIYFVFLQY